MTTEDPRQSLFNLLEGAVSSGVFPGCVAAVWRAGALLYHEAHGRLGTHPAFPERDHAVTRDTVFDLASVTKVASTTTLAAIGVGEGWFDLDAEVPKPWSAVCPEATAADLLEHCSGLVAHREYFVQVRPYDAERVLELVGQTASGYPLRTKSVYSDLGFMILGAWIERAAGRPLDELLADRIAFPLSLEGGEIPELAYRRLPEGAPILWRGEKRIAPTEVYDETLHPDGVPSHFGVREDAPYAQGAVHDDNCFVMGGVAGHAGLFGTAGGVLQWATAWLEGRLPGIDDRVRARFWTPSKVSNSTRRVGFDGVAPDGSGSTGTAMSAAAVGHLGYTGTSVWIDPGAPRGPTVCVLLSNRVHPTRRNEEIKTFRPRFHAAAMRL